MGIKGGDVKDLGTIEVGTGETAYSAAVERSGFERYGLHLIPSGSTPSVKVFLQYRPDCSSTDKWADDSVTQADISVTDTPVCESITVKNMKEFRLKFVGGAGNGADVEIEVILYREGGDTD